MAAPSYTTDLANISLAENDSASWDESSDAGWDEGGTITDEQDYYIQGSYCLSEALKTGIGSLIYDYGSGISWTSGDVFMAWLYCTGPTAMANYSAGGMRMICGSGLGTFYSWDVLGADYYRYGGWVCIPVDPEVTADDTVGSPTTFSAMTKQFWGSAFNLTGNIFKGNSHGNDAMRYGRAAAQFTGGSATGSGYATVAGFAAVNDSTTNTWGLIQESIGGYQWQGLMSLGTTSAAVDFRDSNRSMAILDAFKVTTAFNKIEVHNASSKVYMTAFTFNAAGDRAGAKGSWQNVDNADVQLTNCNFVGMHGFTFDTSTVALNTTWQGCSQVSGEGGSFLNCNVLESTVGVDVGAFLWSSTIAVNGKLDGMAFSKGTNAHHAIDFGATVTANQTLTDMTFEDFGYTNDSNDSTVRFLATTGSLTLSLVGCQVDGSAASATNFSIDDAAGITVTLSISPVTYLIHVADNNGNDLQNAVVYFAAADGTGNLPYNDSVTQILRSATIATVTQTAHGLNSGEYVNLDGITDKTEDNQGAHEITRLTDDTYTYFTTNSGSTDYQGTITATGVLLYGTTDINGDISGSRTLSSDQNMDGFVRKSSASPRFKTFDLAGNTIDATNGVTINIRMILDE